MILKYDLGFRNLERADDLGEGENSYKLKKTIYVGGGGKELSLPSREHNREEEDVSRKIAKNVTDLSTGTCKLQTSPSERL